MYPVAGLRYNEEMKTHFLLGYPLHTGTPEDLLVYLESQWKTQHEHQHVVTLNPEMLMAGEKDPCFGKLLKTANLVLPDGAGVVWALRRRDKSVQRVPGIEFSERLLQWAVDMKEPVALIGGKPDILTETVFQLQRRYPTLNIAYQHHGYFVDEAGRQQVAKLCAEARPGLVLVALGVPAQEYWIREMMPHFTHPAIFVGVGGSFDIWSACKKRAPALFLRWNLEWLYRITTEPFRIKRVCKPLPLFVIKVLLNDRPIDQTV